MHHPMRTLIAPLVAAAAAVLMPSLAIAAEDSAALIKQARDALRKAQSSLVRGEVAAAHETLQGVAATITELKASDADHPQLKSLENSFDRARKEVDAKLPKDRPAAASPPAIDATAAEAVPSGSTPTLMSLAAAALTRGELEDAGKLIAGARAALPNADGESREALRKRLVKLEAIHAARSDPAKDTKLSIVERGRISVVINRVDDIDELLVKAPTQKGGRAMEAFLKDLRSELEFLRKEVGTPEDDADTTLYGAAAVKGTPIEHPRFAAALWRTDDVLRRVAATEERLTGTSTALVDRGAIDADVEQLEAAARVAEHAVSSELERLHPNPMDPEELRQALGVIEKLEAGPVGDAKRELAGFTSAYGSSKDEILAKLGELGYRDVAVALAAWERAERQVQAVADKRKQIAEEIVRSVSSVVERPEAVHDFDFEKRIANLPQITAAAVAFDPANARAKAFSDGVGAQVEKLTRDYKARVDQRTWPAHQGPDNAAELANVAQAFLAAHPEWGRSSKHGVTVEAVAVTGDWRVTLKDLTGRPTQWGLPILVAVKHSADGGGDVLRVFELTAINREEADAKREPPFIGYHVGDSYYIRPRAVTR